MLPKIPNETFLRITQYFTTLLKESIEESWDKVAIESATETTTRSKATPINKR